MNKKKYKIIIFVLIMFLSFFVTIKWLSNKEIDLDTNTIELLLENSGNIEPKNRVINKIVTTINDTKIINPVSVLLNEYKTNDSVQEIIVNNIVDIEEKVPIVYIYNTHQSEKYSSPKEININYSVMDASFYLQKKLEEYGIYSIVETMSVQDVLNSNNWNYATSYRVSKMFMEKAKTDNPSLKFFFDIHRDSVNKSISSITINGVKYAKTMFLLGLENENYKSNESNIVKLENWLNKNYKGLSRGIYRKKGKGVNGVYNQDFSEFCFLIEVGGEENTYEEVENTIDVIAEMISSFIGENNE